ncbi:MAG: GIY-YIG nuclease family protein [Methylocystaceae bacterium]
MDRRKELKLQYKQNPPPMGVYQIRNQVNGKVWVTSAMNLHGAVNRYPSQFTFGSFQIKALQDDWNQYGPDAFVLEILETVDLNEYPENEWPAAVAMLEEMWIEKLQPFGEKGYNKPKK